MNFLCTEMTLDIAKASGPDGISARMLRETEEHISPSLPNFFFYLSIKSRSFPSLWKKLNIVLIPKANDNRNPSNYWTIYLSASYLWSRTVPNDRDTSTPLSDGSKMTFCTLMICSDCTEKQWNHPRLQKLQHIIHAISE